MSDEVVAVVAYVLMIVSLVIPFMVAAFRRRKWW